MESKKILKKPEKKFGEYQQLIYLLVIMGAGIFLRLYNLGKECLWYDEAITYYRAVLGFGEIIKNSYGWDVHPPTYYLIIHFIILGGKSEIALRLFSALCGIAALPLFYFLTHLIIGKKEAIIATLLLALSVFHIRYSQEARVYALFFLSSLLSFLFYYKALRFQKKHDWLLWAGLSIINFHIHYFSLALLISQIVVYIIYSFYKKDIKLKWKYQKWFIRACLLILIGHIPQLFFFFHQAGVKLEASSSYYHSIHPLYFVLIFAKNLINPYDLPLAFINRNLKYFMGLLILLGIITGWKKYKDTFIVNSALIVICLLLSWISSLFIFFGSGHRFLIFLLIPYLLLLSCAIVSLADKSSDLVIKHFKIRRKVSPLDKKIILGGILILILGINSYILYDYYTSQKKPDWEQGVSLLSKYNTKNTTIISIPEWGDYAVRYYLSKLSYDKPYVRRIKITSTAGMDSLSSRMENLIVTTDGLLSPSPFKKNITTWLNHNATLLWQDSGFPDSAIWVVNKN